MSHIRKNNSRCARLRTSTDACGRCLLECPAGAVGIEDSIEIDPLACTDCGRCASVCPSGALHWEPPVRFGRILGHVARRTHSVIGCTKSTTPGRLDAGNCLGWLTEEHLCALAVACGTRVQVDLTQCGMCPNGHVRGRLADSLARAREHSRLPLGNRIDLIVRSEDCWQDADCIDRRRLFALWKEIAEPHLPGFPATESDPPAHREKALPERRKIIQWVARQCNGNVASAVAMNYYGNVDIDSACETCGACTAACPCGALSVSDADTWPAFKPSQCVGCGACQAFCDNAAITVTAPSAAAPTRQTSSRDVASVQHVTSS